MDGDDLLYVKEGISGAVYLTTDKKDPIIVHFFHSIQLKVVIKDTKIKGDGTDLDHKAKHPDSDGFVITDSKSYAASEESEGALECTNETCLPTSGVKQREALSNELKLRKVPKNHEDLEEKSTSLQLQKKSAEKEKNSKTKSFHSVHSSSPSLWFTEGNGQPRSERFFKDAKKNRKRKISTHQKLKADKNSKISRTGTSVKMSKRIRLSSVKDKKAATSKVQTKTRDSDADSVRLIKLKEKSAKWKMAKQISCQYCLKVFENQQAYYDHKKTPRSSSYECAVCQKLFHFKAHLQAHTKAYHLGSKVSSNLKESDSCICDICGSEVKNMFALKKHLMFHTQEYLYKCCICGKQFVEPGTLNNHMTTHKSGGMIRCRCCDQLFATRSALAKHKLALLTVKCYLCEEVFPNRTSRTQHYKIAHLNDILKCTKCASMFSSQEELEVHMTNHNRYKKKQCPTCGKFFSRLEKHVVTHKTKTEIDESELFVCDKCPRKFTNRSSFQRHLSIHSQEKPYQCPNCPLQFSDCGVLRKHLRRHSSLMPYECDVCGKKCKEPGNLKVHMRIHSETKQFQCSLCSQAFNYKSSLEGHIRSRHSMNSVPQTLEYGKKIESDMASNFDIRAAALGSDLNQLCETSLGRLEPDASYNRTGVMTMKSYETSVAQTAVNMMERQAGIFPMIANSLNLEFVPKEMYIGDSTAVTAVNLSALYTQDTNPALSTHPTEETSMNVTSLDTTTVNITSMNVSMY